MTEVTKKIQKYRSKGRKLKPKLDAEGDQFVDRKNLTHSLTKRAFRASDTQMTQKEKNQILEHKAQEIRDEFFQTYIINTKTISPEEIKKARKRVPWHEHMTVTSDKRISMEQNGFNDDVQREIQFYTLTMENAQRAIAYLTQEGVPVQRPSDYEVEMFKSPKQVGKIDNRLVRQDNKIKNLQEKKLKQQGKRLMKMVRTKRMREDHKEKSQNKIAIEEWKKEIKSKGSDKARDLNEFLQKKNQKRSEKTGNKSSKGKGKDGIKKKVSKKSKFNRSGKVPKKNGQTVNPRGGVKKGKTPKFSRQSR